MDDNTEHKEAEGFDKEQADIIRRQNKREQRAKKRREEIEMMMREWKAEDERKDAMVPRIVVDDKIYLTTESAHLTITTSPTSTTIEISSLKNQTQEK